MFGIKFNQLNSIVQLGWLKNLLIRHPGNLHPILSGCSKSRSLQYKLDALQKYLVTWRFPPNNADIEKSVQAYFTRKIIII